ncbi:hypothetical protein HK097_006548, partial [Rhizophlyctis rosea]
TTFPLTLENISTVPINFLTISFAETYNTQPAPTTNARVESPETVYERDVYERGVRVMWLEKGGEETREVDNGNGGIRGEVKSERVEIEILPGERREVSVGVFGKVGSTGGTITLEYGYIPPEDPTLENSDPDPNFYTRRLLVPLVLTVQPALQAMNMDVLLYPASLASSQSSNSTDERALQSRNLSVEEMMVEPGGGEGFVGGLIGSGAGVAEEEAREWSLFTFDLRNGWGHAFEVFIEVFNDPERDEATDFTRTVIHAGVTKR